MKRRSAEYESSTGKVIVPLQLMEVLDVKLVARGSTHEADGRAVRHCGLMTPWTGIHENTLPHWWNTSREHHLAEMSHLSLRSFPSLRSVPKGFVTHALGFSLLGDGLHTYKEHSPTSLSPAFDLAKTFNLSIMLRTFAFTSI